MEVPMMGLRRAGRLFLPTFLGAIFANPATVSLADPSQGPLLDSYMERLRETRQAWRKATELVARGEVERAIQILDKSLPEVLGIGWSEHQKMLGDGLRSMGAVGHARIGTPGFARWCMCMQDPGLAARAYEAAREARLELGFEDKFHLSHCYAEDGQNGKAKVALRDLMNGKIADDWRGMIESRIKALDGLEAGGLSPGAFLRVYFTEIGPRWYLDRVEPLLAAWNLPVASDRDRAVRWDLLTRLFKQMSLPKDPGTGRLLVLKAVANDPLSEPGQVASSLLKLAESAHLAGKADEAKRVWERVVAEFRDTPWWGQAVVSLGHLCMEQRRYSEALAWFRRVLDEPLPAGEGSSGHRFAAQWAIGDCHLEQGRYDLALEAYRATREEHAFRNGCGTCEDGVLNRTALHEGVCLEHLERHPEAVEGYYRRALSPGGAWNPMLSSRLVDLFEAAGQVADLEAMLDEQDGLIAGRVGGTKPSDARHLPSGTIRRILEIRRLQVDRDWDGLISLLHGEHTTMGPENQHARTVEYEAMEAAKRLGRHPGRTVGRLEARLETSRSGDRQWFFYALGLCGTREAVAVLKRAAVADQQGRWASSLAYAFKMAREEGRMAIAHLAPEATGNLKSAFQSDRPRNPVGDEQELPLPEIPAGLKLPRHLKASR